MPKGGEGRGRGGQGAQSCTWPCRVHGACAGHRGPPQSPAWSPRGPRLRLSLPHITEAASRGSAGASSPNSTPRVGKLRLRGGTRDSWPGQSSPHSTPSPPHPQGQVGTHQGPGQGSQEVGAARRLAQGQQEQGPQASASLPPQTEGNPRSTRNDLTSHSEQHLLQEALL